MSTECVLINWFTSYSILSIRFPTRFCICTGIIDDQATEDLISTKCLPISQFDSLVSNQLQQSHHWPTTFCVHSSQVCFKSHYLQYCRSTSFLLLFFYRKFCALFPPPYIFLLEHVLRSEQSNATHLSIYRSNHVALHQFSPKLCPLFPTPAT